MTESPAYALELVLSLASILIVIEVALKVLIGVILVTAGLRVSVRTDGSQLLTWAILLTGLLNLAEASDFAGWPGSPGVGWVSTLLFLCLLATGTACMAVVVARLAQRHRLRRGS